MSTLLRDVLRMAGRKARYLFVRKLHRRRVAYIVFRQVGAVRLYWVGPYVKHPSGWGPLRSAYMLGTRRAALAACRGSALPADVVVVGVKVRELQRRRR